MVIDDIEQITIDVIPPKEGYLSFVAVDTDDCSHWCTCPEHQPCIPGPFLTITPTRITGHHVVRGAVGGVYRDFGEGYFAHAFEHALTFEVSRDDSTNEGIAGLWALCNIAPSTYYDLIQRIGLIVTVETKTNELRFRYNDRSAGTASNIFLQTAFAGYIYNTPIQLKITRTPTQITWGLYDIVGQPIPVDQSKFQNPASIATDDMTYRYLQAWTFRGDNDPTYRWHAPHLYITCYVENLDIGFGPNIFK